VTAVNLGFEFPFFENKYSEVKVSTNGLLLLGDTLNLTAPDNAAIPLASRPDNIIAGFWDDLIVGGTYGGEVRFQRKGSPGAYRAIIEWSQAKRFGESQPLTFQIILYENGNIDLNYATMSGTLASATIGIEDSDGVDGLQLLYNDNPPGQVASNKSFHITYPATGARVKAKPVSQGGIITSSVADFPITIINTGTAADTYRFEAIQITGLSGWTIEVLNPDYTALVNTPSLQPGERYNLLARVHASANATSSQYFKGQVTALSNTPAGRTFTVFVNAAVAAPFSAFYVDGIEGLVQNITATQRTTQAVFPEFNGSSYTLAPVSAQRYFAVWENFRNLQKTVLDASAGKILPTTNLVDNSVEPLVTTDTNPAVAVAPDGKIGLAYIHTVSNPGATPNIYFAMLDRTGSLIGNLINLTKQSGTGVPTYSQLGVAVSGNGNFIVLFESLTSLGGGNYAREIQMAIVSADGQVLSEPVKLNDNTVSGHTDFTPVLTTMQDGNVLVAYMRRLSGAVASQLQYTVVNKSTNQPGPTATINVNGETLQACKLKDGNILLVWIYNDASNIQYTLLNPSGSAQVVAPQDLPPANLWKIGNLAITGEVNGNGILTWQDEWGYALYYALVSPVGGVLTPAIEFIYASDPDNGLTTSSLGGWIAPLDNAIIWTSYLPQVVK